VNLLLDKTSSKDTLNVHTFQTGLAISGRFKDNKPTVVYV